MKEFFRIWLALYGSPQKVQVNNGGEFANDDFLKMTDALGINVLTTAAEPSWSIRVVEKHYQALAAMMDEITKDIKRSHGLALYWVLNTKNSLQNVAESSSNQLVFGKNPNLL